MKVRGILIDPADRSVEEVQFQPDLEGLYQILGVQMVELVRWGEFDLWVDEEGLFAPNRFFTVLTGCRQPLAGRILVAEADRHGEITGTKANLEFVRSVVRWPLLQTRRGLADLSNYTVPYTHPPETK